MKKVKRCGWILTASMIPLVASAQQAVEPGDSSQVSKPAAVQPISTAPAITLSQSAAKAPVSVDQIVDQIIEREHALIQFLKNRTPVIETYLQDLTADAKLGAVPKDDYYFLSRLDLA